MRARQPDISGFVERDGVRVGYESFGDGERAVVFAPADVIVHSRMWKAQVPFLARRHRVVTIDPRGNGRSSRPSRPEQFTDVEQVADIIAVLDTLRIERATLVGVCSSAFVAMLAAADHPDRVEGVVAIGPGAVVDTLRFHRGLDLQANFDAEIEAPVGWQLYNRGNWLREWPAWAAFFFSEICNEPHSTKVLEDVVGWAAESDGRVQVAEAQAPSRGDTFDSTRSVLERLQCPMLVIHGIRDLCQPVSRGIRIAHLAGSELLLLDGAGHLPMGRDPVVVNQAIARFVAEPPVRRSGPLHVTVARNARAEPDSSLPDRAGITELSGCDESSLRAAVDAGDLVVALAASSSEVDPAALDILYREFSPDGAPRRLVDAIAGAARAAVVAGVDGTGAVPDEDRAFAAAVGATLITFEANGVLESQIRRQRKRAPRRVLYLSSPIGLGHVRRDLAIVDELRRLDPDLRVDWLSQSPVTDFLEGVGERVHPASSWLANESSHIEAESGEHDLHAFQAIRRMDEILVANFHVFDDLVRDEEYDAWVGDEAWDVDHFLHENPRLKRAPFVWMTDFVGWLPMPDGGAAEEFLTADSNAEMIEHIAKYPRLRDRSVFVGDLEDVVDAPFGPGLPSIRDWTAKHFDFCGYVMGARAEPGQRAALRTRLGYRPDELVCVVSVGGSGVGAPLLRRVVESYPVLHERLPALRMVVVAGPRVAAESLPVPAGVEVRGFVPDLDLHHAACDVAIVQGGLSTTMELTAAGRPFLYFPLAHHFEQQIHVRHRLDRHRAGRAMDYDTTDPDILADAVAKELERGVDYRPVPTDGARRAADLVSEVL